MLIAHIAIVVKAGKKKTDVQYYATTTFAILQYLLMLSNIYIMEEKEWREAEVNLIGIDLKIGLIRLQLSN